MNTAHLVSVALGAASAAFALVVAWRFGRHYAFVWTWLIIAVLLILRSLTSWLVSFYGPELAAGVMHGIDSLYIPIMIRTLVIVGSVQLFVLFSREEHP